MSPSPVPVTVPVTGTVEAARVDHPTISWGSVIAGMLTAVAIQLALAELCLAAGLAMYAPFDSDSQTPVAIGTLVAWVLCALVGLFAGGWVAGRLAHYHSRVIAGLHGVLVWATGAVVAAVLITTTLGMVAGGTFRLLGDGLKAAGSGVQAAGPAVAQIAAPSWDAIRKQVEEASSRAAGAAQQGTADSRLADASRLSDLLGKFFSRDASQRLSQAEQDELAKVLAAQAGISQEAAVKTIAQWRTSWDQTVARYDAAVNEAKEKAKAAAVAAKNYTATAASIAFGLMLVGAVAAALGGYCGSMAYRDPDLTITRDGVTVRRTSASFG